jgi:uncharacterized protein (TIGR00251 family)
MLLDVRVQPRAKRNALEVRDGRLLARVSAPPADGKANAAVCALIAKQLGLPKRAVQLERGATSREKVVSVKGMADTEVKRCLGL